MHEIEREGSFHVKGLAAGMLFRVLTLEGRYYTDTFIEV